MVNTVVAFNFAFITIAMAIPLRGPPISIRRFPREALAPVSIINVTQTLLYPSGQLPFHTRRTSDAICIEVKEDRVPVVVDLAEVYPGTRASYYLLGYDTGCLDTEYEWNAENYVRATQFGAPVIINQRTPICSFRLINHSNKDVDVVFYDHDSVPYKPRMSLTSCVNLCASSSPWTKYAQSVGIFEQSTLIPTTNVEMEVFSNENCFSSQLTPRKIVRHGDSFLELTRTGTHGPVKSLAVVEMNISEE